MIEKLLLLLALAHVVAGLVLTLLPFAPAAHRMLVATIFGEARTTNDVMFLISVFGPTVASWGVLFYALTQAYFGNPTRGAWRALVLSILIWVPLDSALCIHYGLYAAVGMNLIVALVFLGLLFSVRGLAQR